MKLKLRKRRIAAVLALPVVVLAVVALIQGWTAFGKSATGARRARMEKSPQYKDGVFINPQPQGVDWAATFTAMFHASDDATPKTPVPVAPIDPKQFATAPESGLRITWFGHSSMLVELDGHRVLTDPVWFERVSPVPWAGPTRWFSTGIALDQLPKLDAVVISHDHYDHLDHPTVVALSRLGVRFVVPLGLGAHLEYWGVPLAQIEELDWWESRSFGDLEVTATPARHASGRGFWDRDHTLWAGYSLATPKHRVFYSGDTGLFPALKQIGEKLGPFDLTLIESGQYNAAWPDWHLGPEQAVKAHQWVKGKVMMPVHWSALTLAMHGWTEPVERVIAEAQLAQVTLFTPRPCASVEPGSTTETERSRLATETWWPKVAFQTAKEAPVVSSQCD